MKNNSKNILKNNVDFKDWNYIPKQFDKTLKKEITVFYKSVEDTEMLSKSIMIKDIELAKELDKSILKVSFENYEQFDKEMAEKIVPIMTSNKIMPCFIIETTKGNTFVDRFVVLPDNILVMPETNNLVIHFHMCKPI